jgi:hypothetical protein
MKGADARTQTTREELLLRLPLLHSQVVLRSASTTLSALRQRRVPDDTGQKTLGTSRNDQAEYEWSVTSKPTGRVLKETWSPIHQQAIETSKL